MCETEAESVAYVLATLPGVEPARSATSAGWLGADPAILTAAATNVLQAVNTIAAGLRLDEAANQAADVAKRGPTRRLQPRRAAPGCNGPR